MAAIVQSTSTISNGNTPLAFTGNNSAGNFLIVAVAALTTGQTFTVNDTAGNTYRSLPAVTDTPNTVESQIFFVPTCLAGANTVTFTPGAAVTTVVAIHEFSGVAGISLRSSAVGTGTTITTPASQISPGFAFGFISGSSSGTISAVSPGTGWTQAEANTATPTFLTEWQTGGGVVAASGTFAAGKGGAFPWTIQLAGTGHTSQGPMGGFGFTQWTGW